MRLLSTVRVAIDQAGQGLAHIISLGFAHRDVACRNVFCTATLDGDGRLQRGASGAVVGLRACIADFGRSVRLPAEAGQQGVVADPVQPLRDQPPEVLLSKVFTERSDRPVVSRRDVGILCPQMPHPLPRTLARPRALQTPSRPRALAPSA